MEAGRDPVREQLGEACLRLVAGAVPEATMSEVRGRAMAESEGYPWRAVNDRLVQDPVDERELIEAGLRGQRDWIMRGGGSRSAAERKRPRRTLKVRGKSFLAYLVVRTLFFIIYTGAVVVALLLVKQNWPDLDIYRLLEGLQRLLPGLFPGG